MQQDVNDIIYFDKDADITLIQSKKVAIIGYGNQGRAQALNLKDSDVDVRIGLRKNSKSLKVAKEEGFICDSIESIVKWGDVICCLVPDQYMANIYSNDIKPYLSSNKILPP